MSKLLVAEEDPALRGQIVERLRQRGHAVEAVDSGAAAIETGVRLRPDVLLVDWVLGETTHGLHVAAVLRAVAPWMRTILTTAYTSTDLRAAASQAEVFELLEKPLDVASVVTTVEAALSAPAPSESWQVPVAEVSGEGEILYANRAAEELLDGTRAGREARRIEGVLGDAGSGLVAAAAESWQEAAPEGEEAHRWVVHSRALPASGGWLLVFRDESQPVIEHLPLTKLLLGIQEADAPRWPFRGRGLVFSDNPAVRGMVTNVLSWVDCVCHSAATAEEALDLFGRDENVRVVIFNAQSGELVGRLAGEMGRQRPGTVFVRNGRPSSSPDAAGALGGAFNEVVAGRLGQCMNCSLPVMLIAPRTAVAANERCRCGPRRSENL